MLDMCAPALDLVGRDAQDESARESRAPYKPVALICDDEELILDLMEHHLVNADYDVIRASDGGEAIEHLEAGAPDLVILDVMMPVMDGTEVLRRIRETPQWAHIPVMMLTMRDREADTVEAFQTGASDYVAKPFMVGDLIERANRLIEPQSWHPQTPSSRTNDRSLADA